jgi:glycosyltransferase involved in cell wall biosynthesis
MNESQGVGTTILVMGLRGLPDIPGGVEVHASELYPRLCALGAKVTVLGRSAYRPPDAPSSWRGVNIVWLWSPRMQGLEAVLHTFLGVLYAAVRRPDVVHIHAVGPWLFLPLAKLFGLKVVVTHHGQDYLREKWNRPARAILRLGERLGVFFADERIVISQVILDVVRSTYHRDAHLIPNGVGDMVVTGQGLEKYGLTPYRYVIQVSRLVPEKRQLDLIAAFKAAKLPGWKLLLVGGAQGSQHYADLVRRACAGNNDIVCTGFLRPTEVHELLAQAGVFALPSSHEGLPISLLEAMKLGTPVLASDIPANLQTGLDPASYFRVGDVAMLATRLGEIAGAAPEERAALGEQLRHACIPYDWDLIAASTMKVIERAATRPIPAPQPQVLPKPGSVVTR